MTEPRYNNIVLGWATDGSGSDVKITEPR